MIEGDFAFPFAERLSLDVRVMYVICAGLRQRNDLIGLGIAEFAPAKTDFKFTQVDVPQDEGRSTNHDFLFGPVDAGFLEFVR